MASGTRAFTLIETMCAAAVFGLGLVGVVSLYSKTALYSNQSAHLLAATVAASNRLERLGSLGSQSLLLIANNSVTRADRNGLPAAHPRYSGDFFSCTTTLERRQGNNLNWFDVVVSCAWPEGALRTLHSISLAGRVVVP